MLKLIKNVQVYAPEPLGKKDILLAADKIAAVGDDLQPVVPGVEIETIDGAGMAAVPGFIDSHVHMLGGGGEGSYRTRTPEATLTSLTKAGVTTVVGCLGTDGVTRNGVSLLAKARGLDEEGLTTYIYTGSYRVPITTITGEVMKDLLVVDKVIGVGEIAVSDHRSSQPTFEEFIRLASDARVGGMLSGKAGILNIHLGDGPRKLELIERVIRETEIPAYQFLPTHANRSNDLFLCSVEYAKRGGFVDFTGIENPEFWEKAYDEVPVSKAIRRLLEAGASVDCFTVSSDSQGSLPLFNEAKEFIGLDVGTATCLLNNLRDCIQKEGVPLEIAIRAITANPARILKLGRKGRIAAGLDADLVLLESGGLVIDTVIARGQVMVRGKKPVVLGTFEK